MVGALLGLTCLAVHRNWRDGGDAAGGAGPAVGGSPPPVTATRSPAMRHRLGTIRPTGSPAATDGCRAACGSSRESSPWGRWVWRSPWDSIPGPWTYAWMLAGTLWSVVALLLYLATAIRAVRLPAETPGGVLELLLTTPLSEARIVDGQWRGLMRMIGLPFAGMPADGTRGDLRLPTGVAPDTDGGIDVRTALAAHPAPSGIGFR